MELRAYWAIIWRRLWIIALVFGIVALYVGYQYYITRSNNSPSVSYRSVITMRVGLQATNQSSNDKYSDYSTTSEALADEFVTGPVLTSEQFGTQISEYIETNMDDLIQRYGDKPRLGNWQDPKAIVGSLKATRSHTVVTIDVTWGTEAGAWAIAHAVGEVSKANMSKYLDYEIRSTNAQNLSSHPVAAAQIVYDATKPDQDVVAAESKSKSLLLMLVVGLILGIALAFLVEYLDDRVHSSEEIETLLQLPVYGEVPRAPIPGRATSPRTSQQSNLS